MSVENAAHCPARVAARISRVKVIASPRSVTGATSRLDARSPDSD
jgi:hypothetical protein